MTTSAEGLSTTSLFDRIMARYLAAWITGGESCDERVVRHCYELTRKELDIAPRDASPPLSDEVEPRFARNVAALIEDHRHVIANMREPIASLFIAELLFEKPW